MLKVDFLSNIKEEDCKFAVIVSSHQKKWVFCKHRDRETYESPGGKREENENILETAKRELYEETGAIKYKLKKIAPYVLTQEDNEEIVDKRCGMLFYADILEFGELPNSEIKEICITEEIPIKLTYEEIQYELMNKVIGEIKNGI